jgi:hypothetical protein
MKEDFLHYVWRYALYSQNNLQTITQEPIAVIKPGVYNTDQGPDFLNSELIIGNQKWVGNVEIHVNASDWYVHRHELDKNYDAVILHVVWNYDAEIYMKDNTPLPTLELRGLIPGIVITRYKKLVQEGVKWIPCEDRIQEVDSFVIHHWLERLYFERLENKTSTIEKLLEESQNDWEAVLFMLLSKNFGLKVNGDAFLQLAKSFHFTVLRKERHTLHSLLALLFGQAGFLETPLEDEYHQVLREEYIYLKKKHRLKSLSENEFQFFRMRPFNFPTIRIAQLVALYFKKGHLFGMVIKEDSIVGYRALFDLQLDEYWKTHFHFGKPSKRSAKKLTNSFIDLILINTILPLKFHYLKTVGKSPEGNIVKLISDIKPEKNSIVSKFKQLQINAKNALESQALLELKNSYCAPKHCLRCAIGKTLLNKG